MISAQDFLECAVKPQKSIYSSMAHRTKRRRLSTSQGAAGVTAKPGVQDEASGQDAPNKLHAEGQSSSKDDQKPSKQLFVRSLPPTATQENLTEHFSRTYPIKHAVLVCDPVTKTSKGYGFVTFADIEDAARAKEELHGSKFDGHKIRVDYAKPRHRVPDSDDAADGLGDGVQATDSSKPKEQRSQHYPEAKKPPRLIIRNLPWSIKNSDQLATLFRSYGKVKHAILPQKKPGLLSGFGFVTLRGHKNAEKAIQGVNGKVIDGRAVTVDWAVEKQLWEESHQEAKAVTPKALKNSDSQSDRSISGSEAPSEPGDGSEGDDGSAGIDMAPGEAETDEGEGHGTDAEAEGEQPKLEDNTSTIFVRNVPFTTTDDSLYAHFKEFGPVRYARIVIDAATDRPRGTAFVCFYRKADADACIHGAPRQSFRDDAKGNGRMGDDRTPLGKFSVLQDEFADPTGRYTLEGRVLHVMRVVGKDEATKLTEEGRLSRNDRERDKRRLYLLSEGAVSSKSPLYQLLTPTEIKLREASVKQRSAILQRNPSLHLSLTRLSVRNIPRNFSSKDLKALARQAVVGFAKDVKENRRLPLSKEELDRGGEEMKQAEIERKKRGKGIVKQAKIVFEGREGGKVTEKSGAGRSRGYGFIEYTSHRWALMGLRWLNGHAISSAPSDAQQGSSGKEQSSNKQRRLIVEFAIENAQVVTRRREREAKTQARSRSQAEKRPGGPTSDAESVKPSPVMAQPASTKRKRANSSNELEVASGTPDTKPNARASAKEQLARRQKIIAKKRMQRKSRRVGAGTPPAK